MLLKENRENSGRGERRRNQRLDDFEEWRKYWKLEKEAQYCTISSLWKRLCKCRQTGYMLVLVVVEVTKTRPRKNRL